MAKVAIKEKNAEKIENMLKEANGNAEAHTYTVFQDVAVEANHAENSLKNILLPKNFYKGAHYLSISGEKLPNAYKYSRKVTRIVLERGSKDWFLTEVKSLEQLPNQGKFQALIVTEEQDREAVKRFREKYTCYTR